jgi:hypothetical protein
MAEGHYLTDDSDPRICIMMDQHVFDAINAHSAKCGEPFTTVARELLRCAVEDGKLDEYYPRKRRRRGWKSLSLHTT